MIVYATGFDAITGSFDRIDIRGEGGVNLSEKWRAAAAGEVFTSHFPFWWDDMWLLDVWLNSSGSPMLPLEVKQSAPHTYQHQHKRDNH